MFHGFLARNVAERRIFAPFLLLAQKPTKKLDLNGQAPRRTRFRLWFGGQAPLVQLLGVLEPLLVLGRKRKNASAWSGQAPQQKRF
jgi:hypothetical protein